MAVNRLNIAAKCLCEHCTQHDLAGASCRCDLSLPMYRPLRVLKILETVAAVSLTSFQFDLPNAQAAYFKVGIIKIKAPYN